MRYSAQIYATVCIVPAYGEVADSSALCPWKARHRTGKRKWHVQCVWSLKRRCYRQLRVEGPALDVQRVIAGLQSDWRRSTSCIRVLIIVIIYHQCTVDIKIRPGQARYNKQLLSIWSICENNASKCFPFDEPTEARIEEEQEASHPNVEVEQNVYGPALVMSHTPEIVYI